MSNELMALMAALAERRGWRSPQAELGRYALVLDLNLELSLFQVDRLLYLEGWIAALPGSGPAREELLRRLLRLHLARIRDHGEVLTLADAEPNGADGAEPADPAGDARQLMLYWCLDVTTLDLPAFEEALGSFASALDFWVRAAAQAPAPAGPPPGARMLFP